MDHRPRSGGRRCLCLCASGPQRTELDRGPPHGRRVPGVGDRDAATVRVGGDGDRGLVVIAGRVNQDGHWMVKAVRADRQQQD